MPADGAQEYEAIFLCTLNGYYPAVLFKSFSLHQKHTLILFLHKNDPATVICSICCLKVFLLPPNCLCSGITKEFRHSIGVNLLAVFLKI